MENKLYGKKIIWDGDSIGIGLVETGSWATRIAENNSMTCKNYARGGGTIVEGLPKMKNGADRHSVSVNLEKMYEEHPDADYIILQGGANDSVLLGNVYKNEPNKLGTFEAFKFDGDYDVTTFSGALESVFYRALKYWNGKKIGFIVAQKCRRKEHIFLNRRIYFDRAVEICEKWGIPYIDLWRDTYMNPNLPNMYDPTKTAEENKAENVCYYYDNVHLTSRGYDFSSEAIETWLKTL